MFRTIGDRPSLWESRLPPEVLRLPEELARVDALLDDPAFFAPFAPYFHPVIGRPSTPVEWYLRLMFLKFRYRLGYESLCAEVSDSITWRRFCRIPLDGKVPHPTTLMKLTTRCGERRGGRAERGAAGQGRRGEAAAHRAGARGHHGDPRERGLPDRLGAAGQGGRQAGAARRGGCRPRAGPPGRVMTDRRRAAARRVRADRQQAAQPRQAVAGEESSQVIRRVTGELADLARRPRPAGRGGAAQRPPGRARRRSAGGCRGRLRRALDELAVTDRAHRPDRRPDPAPGWPGRSPDGATRLVSLHDPDARPIRKGRIDRPVEFGYKAQVTDNDDGIVLDYSVEYGAAPDGPQLAPAIERVSRRAGRVPRAVTADRGYGQAAVERDLHDLGVRTVAIPRQGQTSAAPARPSSTAAASAGWSSGAPAAKAGSATSSAATAGTAPAWTAGKEPRSGADTGSSPTTWSRSAPWPADPAQTTDACQAAPPPELSPPTFSGRSS